MCPARYSFGQLEDRGGADRPCIRNRQTTIKEHGLKLRKMTIKTTYKSVKPHEMEPAKPQTCKTANLLRKNTSQCSNCLFKKHPKKRSSPVNMDTVM